jgi:GNAT superfamily N-acetyltransferase
MQIIKASPEHFDIVRQIVVETIKTVYPHYYPRGAVDFFLSHHSDEAIRADIDSGSVCLFKTDGDIFATGTVTENEISRLFVLPQFQGQGFGRKIMDYFESTIFRTYDAILLHASLAAVSMYRARGYKETEFFRHKTDNGDFLCVYIMRLAREDAVIPAFEISYDGRRFVAQQNSPNGEVNGETVFQYHQNGSSIWAEYAGGGIVKGLLTGHVLPDKSLEFAYVHMNEAGETRVGECRSVPELLPDGRLLMHESWQWLTGDESAGESTLIEVE